MKYTKTCANCGGITWSDSPVPAGKKFCLCGDGRRPGLGDMVAAGLSAVGITPERLSNAMGVKDCGCKRRAEALNRLGRRLGIG